MLDFLYKKKDDEKLAFIEISSKTEAEIDSKREGTMSDYATAMRDMYYRGMALSIHNKEKREKAINCLSRFV